MISSVQRLATGVLSVALAGLPVACDSKRARGDECTPSASKDEECEPGLVCGAVSASSKTTCEKQCSVFAADAGISECTASETCTPLLSGSGLAVCVAK